MVAAHNIPPVVYVLLTNHYATLKELRDDYDIWEALQLYECCMVSLKNKYEITKGAQHGKQ